LGEQLAIDGNSDTGVDCNLQESVKLRVSATVSVGEDRNRPRCFSFTTRYYSLRISSRLPGLALSLGQSYY